MTRLRLGLGDGLRVSPRQQGLLGRLVQQSVAASADDANEVIGGGSDGVVSITGTGIGFQSDRFAGFRFTPGVPQGARVLRAYIQFTSSTTIGGSGIAACSVTIWCQSVDNAATFTTASKNVTNRAKTGQSVSWNLPSSAGANAWLTGDRGLNQRTPDLRHVVQEVVERAGWVSGNGLVVLAHQADGGLGARQVAARDHATLAPACSPSVRSAMRKPGLAAHGRHSLSPTRLEARPLARHDPADRTARYRAGDRRKI